MYETFYQNIPKGSRDRAIFWIWTSAKHRPMMNGIWQSLELHLVNINVHAKVHYNIPLCSRDRAIYIFFFFRIWSLARPWPMINIIFQSLGLELANINVYAKLYQNIPNGLRAVGIFRELSRNKQFHKLSGGGQVWIWTSAQPWPITNVIW